MSNERQRGQKQLRKPEDRTGMNSRVGEAGPESILLIWFAPKYNSKKCSRQGDITCDCASGTGAWSVSFSDRL